MYKLLAISLLVLCAEIHSLDIQNDQQKPPIPTDKVIKEQKVEVKDTIVPNEKVPINPNQQSSIQTDKETKEQKVKVSDTVLPSEKGSINSNSNSPPTQDVKKLAPKITNDQIQSLADQVLAIHGVKEGEDDPENIQRAARLTKVVENVVKNLETKLKEKKEGESLSGSEQVAAKTENLATGSLDEKKAGIPEENVSITKEAEEKQKLETNAKVGSGNPENNIKNVERNEKTEENQNGKGQNADKVEETLKKAAKEEISQEKINQEVNKSEDIKIEIIDIDTETKLDNVETIKIEIKPETVEDAKVEQVIVKEIKEDKEVKRNEFADADVEEQLEELEDAIEEDNAKRDASEDAESRNVPAEPTNQENEDTENGEEEVKYTEDYGYFTIIVDFIYDKFLSN